MDHRFAQPQGVIWFSVVPLHPPVAPQPEVRLERRDHSRPATPAIVSAMASGSSLDRLGSAMPPPVRPAAARSGVVRQAGQRSDPRPIAAHDRLPRAADRGVSAATAIPFAGLRTGVERHWAVGVFAACEQVAAAGGQGRAQGVAHCGEFGHLRVDCGQFGFRVRPQTGGGGRNGWLRVGRRSPPEGRSRTRCQ